MEYSIENFICFFEKYLYLDFDFVALQSFIIIMGCFRKIYLQEQLFAYFKYSLVEFIFNFITIMPNSDNSINYQNFDFNN